MKNYKGSLLTFATCDCILMDREEPLRRRKWDRLRFMCMARKTPGEGIHVATIYHRV